MEQKIPMTSNGYKMLQQELKHLKSVERPAVVELIAEARGHGDLSENAEYHAAKEKQMFIENRIAELEERINRAEVFNPLEMSGEEIRFGATVTLHDEDLDVQVKYQIVGSDEADIKKGLLSITSPLARSLISKKKDEAVEVITPSGGKSYTICEVKYI